MAIDYGDARIGLAVSDPTGTLAGEAWILKERHVERAVLEIAAAAKHRGVERLVVGYPRNMDGSVGARAEKTGVFAEVLREASGLETVFWDERRTTVDALAILHAAGRRGKKKKKVLDAVAATLILEGYLAFLAGGGKREI